MIQCLPTIALVMLAAIAGTVRAHGGGLNAEGCHNDRRNGGYHCHRGTGVPQKPVADSYAPRDHLADDATPQNGSGAFRNCTAARAAGMAPVRRGDPGYGSHLDRDGDGVGCE